VNANYTNAYTNFIDVGGNELSNKIGARGVYRWGQEHNLHAGYTIDFLKPREGDSSVVHTFDIGDDFLAARNSVNPYFDPFWLYRNFF
jgi:hypothetical protein